MTRSIDEANRYISAVRQMPNGPAKSAAALAEVDRIDAEGPPEAKAYALHALIEAYVFGDGQEKAIVPFTQAIALYDAHPEWFDEADRYNLFWSFKWMVSELRRFPNVSLAQQGQILDEMERRYALEGFTMDAPYQQRWLLARHRGADDAPGLYDRWLLQTRDELSDCELCSPGDRVEHTIEIGNLEDGLNLMERVFADETIKQECFSEPAGMLSMAQFAYLQRGQPGDTAKAASAHRRCRGYLGGSTLGPADDDGDSSRTEERRYALAEARGRCIEFLARTGNEDAAVRLLEDNRDFLIHAESPLDHLDFLRHAGAALRVLVDDCGMADRAVAVKAPLPLTLGELWPWVRSQAEAVAAEFDARNGTTHQTDLLRDAWQGAAFQARLDMRVVPAEPPAAVTTAIDEPSSGADEEAADPSRLVSQADKLANARDPETAIDVYLQAAAQFEQQGRLSDAGFARAEAGHLALQLDDIDGAEQCLGRATQLLKATAVAPQYASPVSVALAECLSRRGETDRATAILDQQAALLDTALAEPRLDGQSDATGLADLRWARTRVDEARATMLLNLGDAAGAALAEQAAKSYASLGMIEPAAQAFGLAGRGWTGVDDDKAVWCLQSALEGYKMVFRKQLRLVVANQLVALLQHLGRNDEAEQVTTDL